ncbi:hypothetical protein BJY59DRAFT_687050 [Rhodotorula toruloides]
MNWVRRRRSLGDDVQSASPALPPASTHPCQISATSLPPPPEPANCPYPLLLLSLKKASMAAKTCFLLCQTPCAAENSPNCTALRGSNCTVLEVHLTTVLSLCERRVSLALRGEGEETVVGLQLFPPLFLLQPTVPLLDLGRATEAAKRDLFLLKHSWLTPQHCSHSFLKPLHDLDLSQPERSNFSHLFLLPSHAPQKQLKPPSFPLSHVFVHVSDCAVPARKLAGRQLDTALLEACLLKLPFLPLRTETASTLRLDLTPQNTSARQIHSLRSLRECGSTCFAVHLARVLSLCGEGVSLLLRGEG